MHEGDSRAIAYLREVYEDSQRFANSLLRENERLRRQVAELAHELGERAAATPAQPQPQPQPQPAQAQAAPEASQESIEARLRTVERENQRLSSEHRALQEQSTRLLHLYVAAHHLHSTLDRKEVLEALHEIIANMVGCEQLAIFELEEGEDELHLISSAGIDAELYASVALGDGAIGHAARTGEVYLGGAAPAAHAPGRTLVASIPMALAGRVSGVIALFELLGQKSGLDSDDLELFNLLRTHAGTALYCTRLHGERRRGGD
jgi:nitrate/nitrite-specific signal transduction histidine kinase